LVELLGQNGYPVRIFSRNGGKGRKPEPRITYFAGATHESEAISRTIDRVQIIFDLAANPAGSWEEM